jgi:Skp family chaperone for outer membrane proteins
MILLCAVSIVGLQFSSMRMELAHLNKQVHDEKMVEKKLEHEIHGIHAEINKVEHAEKKLEAEEHMLQKKEQKFEQEFKNKDTWGEENPHDRHHTVH